MKNSYLLLLLFFFCNCSSPIEKNTTNESSKIYTNSIETENYELILTSKEQKGVLILFPGFPETPAIVKEEFKVIGPALQNGISVVLMKFNQRLWLETEEKFRLTKIINDLFALQNLSPEKVYIGGFSAGGNISLLFANHLMQTQNIIQPEGVFVVDAPIDLLALYEIAQRNIERNFAEISVQESKGIFRLFEPKLGIPSDGIENYEFYAPYTFKTNNTSNLIHLKDVKMRLYTEPDIKWWQENRQNEWEDMNAFYIKKLSDELRKKFGNQVEYIATENRGYRANGQRHPHSWAIVEIDKLLEWMMEN